MKQLTNLKTKILIIYFTLFVFSSIILSETETILPEAEWTVLIISQTKTKGKPDLHDAFVERLEKAEKLNLDEFNKKLNVLIQWETSPEFKIPKKWMESSGSKIERKENEVPRYKMTKEGLQFIQKVPLTDYPQKIVDFVQWGISNYPSKYLALILDDHGSGIIDPKAKIPTKGILFNLENKTYLNTQQLGEAMQQIKNILGRKVDLVGFDACLMAAIEVQYQIRDEATIFVGSEEIEKVPGWPLPEIFKKLASHPLTPFELANVIVYAYGSYYQKPSGKLTLSAVNLEDIINLKENHDQIIARLKVYQESCNDKIKKGIENAVKNTRDKCYGFQNPFEEPIWLIRIYKGRKPPIYVDLSSFYSELQKNLQDLHLSKTKDLQDLEESLTAGIKLIEKAVIANVTGRMATQAKGISIYFPVPRSFIDASYLKTKFAQESKWLEFLEQTIVKEEKIGVYTF